jgi:hypothetical protein
MEQYQMLASLRVPKRSGVSIPVVALLFCAGAAPAQIPCRSTAVYQPCDIELELTEQEAAQHPNPYISVELRAEFRGPKGDTYRLPGFWDGGRKFKIRFSPLAEGRWDFRVTSNIERFTGKIAGFTATPPVTKGFVSPFNVHHFQYSQPNTGHLWMGDTCYRFATIPAETFRKLVDIRAAQKFNHLRGFILGDEENAAKIFPSPDRIVPELLQNIDERILYMNQKGITCDLILAGENGQLQKLFPAWKQRERYIRYLVARYAAMNITWQGLPEFEHYPDGPEVLKAIGGLLRQLDPYHHPRSTGTMATSGPLANSGWLDYVTYQSFNPNLFAVEHQLYPEPFVNVGFGSEDSGAGKPGPDAIDTDTFRRRMWNAAINGQYITFANTGTSGIHAEVDLRFADSPGARQAKHLYEFFAQTRHFELEPYFKIENARALALEDVEYVVYIEKPGPVVELAVEKAGYDVSWFNPINGEFVDAGGFKGERYTAGPPPDPSHDWVLYIRREGKKQGMARSYKFESRTPEMHDVETGRKQVPFTIQLPAENELPVGQPLEFNATLLNETRATRSMIWLWTGEVSSSGAGYRVLGSSQFGEFTIPPDISREYPAAMLVRLYGLDGNGKLFAADKVYTIKKP